MTKRLIEEWLPIAELGIESVRERTPMTPFPAPNRLHVWWARRPLVASRAAVLASLLPADADPEKFMHVLGIHGDPVEAKRRIAKADRDGVRLGADAYGYSRAFGYNPTEEEQEWFRRETLKLNIETPKVLDPTSGGGSIPFESYRLGCEVFANDLNPVAVLVQQATFEWPTKIGKQVVEEFRRITPKYLEEIRLRLEGAFPEEPHKDWRPDGYLWARTIVCPYCEGVIPLSPNWKLDSNGTGIRLLPQLSDGPGGTGRVCGFQVVENEKDQSKGTIKSGKATCPFSDCNRVVDGDEVKAQAQANLMGEQLFTVVYKERQISYTKTGKACEKWVRGFRAPRPEDDNNEKIIKALDKKKPEWEALNLIPNEPIPEGHKTDEPRRYGMTTWQSAFSSRQLLCHGTSVEVFREMLIAEEESGSLSEATKAAYGLLSLALDKLLNWNARLSSWNVKARLFRSDHAVLNGNIQGNKPLSLKLSKLLKP